MIRSQLLGVQLPEHHDLVDPVEELRPHRLAQPAHDPVAQGLLGVAAARRGEAEPTAAPR